MTPNDAADSALRADVTDLLTEAARHRRPNGDPADFADFLAQVLVSAAANVGGSDRLLAGRPDSWEARLIADLLEGTMGPEPASWLRYRTEPVVVPLNVAELIKSHPDHEALLGLDDAIDDVDHRYWTTRSEADGVADELDPAQHDRELTAMVTRYNRVYRAYAEKFSEAVQSEVERIGAEGPINVLADTNPRSTWWEPNGVVHNPDPFADEVDADAVQVWEFAHDITPLPNVDIRAQGAPLP